MTNFKPQIIKILKQVLQYLATASLSIVKNGKSIKSKITIQRKRCISMILVQTY